MIEDKRGWVLLVACGIAACQVGANPPRACVLEFPSCSSLPGGAKACEFFRDQGLDANQSVEFDPTNFFFEHTDTTVAYAPPLQAPQDTVGTESLERPAPHEVEDLFFGDVHAKAEEQTPNFPLNVTADITPWVQMFKVMEASLASFISPDHPRVPLLTLAARQAVGVGSTVKMMFRGFAFPGQISPEEKEQLRKDRDHPGNDAPVLPVQTAPGSPCYEEQAHVEEVMELIDYGHFFGTHMTTSTTPELVRAQLVAHALVRTHCSKDWIAQEKKHGRVPPLDLLKLVEDVPADSRGGIGQLLSAYMALGQRRARNRGIVQATSSNMDGVPVMPDVHACGTIALAFLGDAHRQARDAGEIPLPQIIDSIARLHFMMGMPELARHYYQQVPSAFPALLSHLWKHIGSTLSALDSKRLALSTENAGASACDLLNMELRREHKSELQQAFSKKGYAVVRNVMTERMVKIVGDYYDYIFETRGYMFTDPQAQRFHLHNDAFCRFFQVALVDVIESVTDQRLKPSYCYYGGYVAQSTLPLHVDRDQCYLSMTIQLGQDIDSMDAWPITIWDRFSVTEADEYVKPRLVPIPNLLKGLRKEKTDVHLGTGDVMIYDGRFSAHSRDPLPGTSPDTVSHHFFLHYIPWEWAVNLY